MLLLAAVGVGVIAQTNIRVVSVNVWSGLTYEGTFRVSGHETAEERAFRYGLLVRQLEELDPDIVVVNEANPLPGYAKRLARDLDMRFAYGVRAGGVRLGPVGFPVNLREGEAVLVGGGIAIEYLGNRDIIGGPSGNVGSFTLREPTQVLATKISVGGTEFYLFATRWSDTELATEENLDQLVTIYSEGLISSEEYLARVAAAVAGEERRIEEAHATMRVVEEISARSAAIIAGSLHTVPGSAPLAIVEQGGFVDAFEGAVESYTRDGERNSLRKRYFSRSEGEAIERLRVDYVFLRGENLAVSARALAFDEATFETHPSDHFGIVVDIEIGDSG